MDALCKTCHGLFRKYIGKSMQAKFFVYTMRTAVCLLNVFPYYSINSELVEYLPEMEKYLYKSLFNLILILNLLSYFTASLLKPVQIPKIEFIEEQEKRMCDKCQKWKPERTSHCSICEICVPKMDHHCPWLGNCVGQHNLKPFFLFCFYQFLEGIVML